MHSRKIIGNIFTFLVYTFMLLPLVVVIASAFGTTDHVTFPPQGFTLHWFSDAIQNEQFMESLLITLGLCVVSVFIATVMGLLVSLYFWKTESKAKAVFESIFTAPVIVPTVISAVSFLLFFSMFNFIDTFWKLALAYSVIEMPYVIRSVTASLSTLDASFEDASLVLGARPLKTLFLVTLPCIKSGISVGAIFAFIVGFDESVIVLFIRNARTITYPLRLYSYITQSFTPLVSAFATLFILLTFVLIYFLDKKIGIGKMF